MTNPDDMQSVFLQLKPLVFLSCFLALGFSCTSGYAGVKVRHRLDFQGATVKDRVGSRNLRFRGCWIQPRHVASAQFPGASKPYALLVRIVVPDDLPGHHLAYEVSVNHIVLTKRELKPEGVGRRSQFVRVDDPAILKGREQVVEVRNTGSEPLFLESILVLNGYQEAAAQPFDKSDFILSFLVSVKPDQGTIDRLREFSAPPGAVLALGTEIHFASPDSERVLGHVKEFQASSDLLGWPVVPSIVSWWAGTPPEVAQRLDFQQVCYSRTDTYDEGQKLKDLLGDKWRIEYGLTVPNIWSSTPWQTTNNPELNMLRKTRLDKLMPELIKILGPRVRAFITENEPMYWAGEFPDGNYPVKREDLLADFNPHTVAAAAKDGVTLDPVNGLDMKERWWLYQNLAKYIETTAAWINSHARPIPVYTHALLEDHFPMKYSGHCRPAMEMAVSKDFPAGLECLWDTNIDKLQRLRELGQWGLVNREECDGRPVSQHVALALAIYAMGADMLNSYNWNGLQPEFSKEYFNSFAASLPEYVVASATSQPDDWLPLTRLSWVAGADPDKPWGTCLKVRLRNTSNDSSYVTLTVFGAKSRTIVGFSRRAISTGADKWVSLELDSMTDAAQHQDLIFSLKAEGGIEIAMAGKGRPEYKWIFNAAEERRRSQIIRKLF